MTRVDELIEHYTDEIAHATLDHASGDLSAKSDVEPWDAAAHDEWQRVRDHYEAYIQRQLEEFARKLTDHLNGGDE